MSSFAVRTASLAALLVGAAVLAPVAGAASSVNPTLDVYFAATGTITVSLPDGTAVGAASGAPTVIPAGYYSVVLSGPGGCTWTPYFELKGPGEDIVDNLAQGQFWSNVYTADLQPNSTYTWISSGAPSVLNTFVTTGTTVGAAPAKVTSTGSFSGSKLSNSDVVGSDVSTPPFRGSVSLALGSAGRLSLAYNGKPVASLAAGRYTFSVASLGRAKGLTLQTTTTPITAPATLLEPRHTTSVDLTPGTWILTTGVGKTAYSISVH